VFAIIFSIVQLKLIKELISNRIKLENTVN